MEETDLLTKVLTNLGALAGVGVLVGIAWLLGFRKRAKIEGPDHVARLLAEAEPGAGISDIAMDKDGYAAVAKLTDGRLFIVRSMADKLAIRLISPASLKLKRNGATVRLDSGEAAHPPLTLHLEGPAMAQWLDGPA